MKSVWLHTDALSCLKKIKTASVDFIFTSPPYAVGKEYENKDLTDNLSLQEKVIVECHRILKPTGSICWQTGFFVNDGELVRLATLVYPIFKRLGFKLRNEIVWQFSHGLHCKTRFSGRYETVQWFTKTDDYYFNLDPVRFPNCQPDKKNSKGKLSCNPKGKNPGDVWFIQNVKNGHPEKLYSHPCQTPTELIIRLLRSLCPEGGVVVDPFGGVASTYVSALYTGRKCISCEKKRFYFLKGKNRIKNFKKLVFHNTIRIQFSEIKTLFQKIKSEMKEQKKRLKYVENEELLKLQGYLKALEDIQARYIRKMLEPDKEKIIIQQVEAAIPAIEAAVQRAINSPTIQNLILSLEKERRRKNG